ncbi:folliculin-interacting protein 1, partial [Asbolus verrucosus]
KDQVRVVLFRECDFRGRKLLFDSSSVKKILIGLTKSGEVAKTAENEKISEISNGYGYVYTKPQPDFNQLAEMVFGSVAMSFRGTYFKMHNLESPNRLMFTQVFSSPRPASQGRFSVSSRSDPHTLEHSKLDDSGASSTNSMSEHLSVHSTASDTVLVSVSIPSLIGDSGYCADQSCPLSSGPPSISTWGSIYGDNATSTMSSSSLYKRWLRRTSTSLDNSGQSLANSVQEGDHARPHHRSSKLGLALILDLTSGQEEELSQFFMEHVSLLEVMLWRARQVVETAYVKSQNFASLMVEMAHFSAQYLVNLLSGSYLSMNLWLSISSGCDSNSISAFSDKTVPASELAEDFDGSISWSSSCSSAGAPTEQSGDFHLFNFSKFLKADPFNIKKSLFGESRNLTAEKFVQDFCELLEVIDVKDTNFFMSTLLTAVLTYHLGWVNTCLPSKNATFQSKSPFNPLWSELSDLYGAVGHPTKVAQTIVTGTNRKDLISKILLSMTYFIRCCDVDRRVPIRADVQEENRTVEMICRKYSCIPKENYKKYEDHLKEIMNLNKEFFVNCQNNNYPYCKNIELEKSLKDAKPALKKATGLIKTKTCFGDLSDFAKEEVATDLLKLESHKSQSLYPDLTATETLEALCSTSKFPYPSNEEITRKVNTLCRVPSSSVLCHMDKQNNVALIEEIKPPPIVTMEKQMRSLDLLNSNVSESEKTRDVVFVLGDNEELVGIKKGNSVADKSEKLNNFVKPRPSFLDLSKQLFCVQDSDFVENPDNSLVKPSTSWSSLADKEANQKVETESRVFSKKLPRSQSEPPESRKPEESKSKSKYRYSGVKFNLQQYPQILSNYMKSKNLEISNLQFGDKSLKLDDLSSLSDTIISKYPEFDEDYEEGEALQTPSNASELEFTSDTFVAPSSNQQTKESNQQEVLEKSCDDVKTVHKMKVTNLPMPNCHSGGFRSKFYKPGVNPIRYTSSLMRAASDSYMPDMVLQGPIVPKQDWESRLKSDLALASQHSLIDQPVEEAVAVIANTDTWEVQLMSSHTFIIDKGSSGIRIGMSQLVANMLESLLQMWKLNVPPHFCLMHIEQTLQELCIRSKALAELLMATEFCSMEQLTSALQLEVNDVPLLLAVASTHSPQVTQKYGLSFQ